MKKVFKKVLVLMMMGVLLLSGCGSISDALIQP